MNESLMMTTREKAYSKISEYYKKLSGEKVADFRLLLQDGCESFGMVPGLFREKLIPCLEQAGFKVEMKQSDTKSIQYLTVINPTNAQFEALAQILDTAIAQTTKDTVGQYREAVGAKRAEAKIRPLGL